MQCSTGSSPTLQAASEGSSISVLPSLRAKQPAASIAFSRLPMWTRLTRETGLTDGLLSRLSTQGELPKVMYTYTSSEYWAGHGALVHVDVEGTQDVEPPDSVRVYTFAGTQHALAGCR